MSKTTQEKTQTIRLPLRETPAKAANLGDKPDRQDACWAQRRHTMFATSA